MLMAGMLLSGLYACDKNNFAVDVDPIIPPEKARFLTTKTVDAFYIQNNASGGTEYKIPIGVTTVSDAARTIQLTYASSTGAAAGAQYTAPPTITIPAGKTIDTLTVKGIFAGFTSTRRDSLKITITGPGSIPNAYNKEITLVMRKYCDVVLANLSGDYPKTNEYNSAGAFQYGPYTTSVSNLTSTGATSATGKLNNLYDDSWLPIDATFDWSNPAAFKVTIAAQSTGKTYSGLAASVRSSTASGAVNTFSSCDNSISLAIDIFSGSTVLASNYRIIMAR
jgi:hypothetical protein